MSLTSPQVRARAEQPVRARPAKRGRPRRLPTRGLLRLISPIALILLWQLASGTGLLPAAKLASPVTIYHTATSLIADGQLGDALAVSLRRVAIGFVIGLLIGVFFGVAAGLSKWTDLLVDPPMQMLRTLPFLGLIPLFIVWFGIGEAPKIALVALGTAFPLYVNVHAGIRDADRRLIEATTVLGFTRWQRLRHVVVPAAIPASLVGLRIGLAAAWLSLVVAEQINADSGLGFLINNGGEFLRNDIVLVGLFVYALLGLLTDGLVRLIERRVLRWRNS